MAGSAAGGVWRPRAARRARLLPRASLFYVVTSWFVAVAPCCVAIEPVPQAPDIVTLVNRNSPKDVRLDANLYIPDGGELLLNIDVPKEQILVDSHAPAKITRVYSTHADGTFGVGEDIDILVEFTSAVDVIGTPSLLLATGCHASACHIREIQRLRCQGTTGKFAVSFADQRVVNIPADATAKQFAQYLQRMTKIDRVLVDYLQSDRKACTFFGNNITITFESVNIDGADGDLPEMTADISNGYGDGSVLGHVRLAPTLSATAWEIQKGRRVLDRYASYVGRFDPQTLLFRYTVRDGDNTTKLEYANSDALTRSILQSGNTIFIRNAGSLINADTTLPPPKSIGDWERGTGSSLSANCAIQVDVNQPKVTVITSPHDDGTFGIGEVILVHVYFSLPVVVTGMPTIVLETGQVDRIIPFVRVTGANDDIVEFLYVVQARDTSPDLTYTGTSALKLNGGTIKRKSTAPSTNAVLILPVNGEKGSLSWSKNIVVDTSNPKVTAVTSLSPDGTYTGGDTIQIQIAFDTPVVVTGSPQLLLSTGSVDLFPGSYIQAAPTPSSSKTIVFPGVDHGLTTDTGQGLQFLTDGQVYTVSSVVGDSVTMIEDYVGTIVDPTVLNGPALAIRSPGYRPAVYSSGSGTNNLIFVYNVQRGDSSVDLEYTSITALQLNGGSIKRLSTSPFTDADTTLPIPGAAGSLSSNAFLVVNTDNPRVLQVNPITRDGVYRVDDTIIFTVLFNLPVVVQTAASILTTASSMVQRFADYTGGSGSTTITFRLDVSADDQVNVVDVFDSMSLRPAFGFLSGFIRRLSRFPLVPAILDLPSARLTSKGIAIDQSCAFVTSVSTTHKDGKVGAGEVISIVVVYNVPVDVVTAAGTPVILLTTQKPAVFVSGSGTSALAFQYIVQQSDPAVRLAFVDMFSLQLGGATIRETGTGKVARTLLPYPQMVTLATQQAVYVDTIAPIVVDVSSRLLDGSYTVGDRAVIAVTMSSPVVVASPQSNRGVPVLYLQLGGPTNVATPAKMDSSTDAQLYFTINIASGHSSANLAYPSRNSLRCVGNYGVNINGAQGNAITPHGVEFQNRLLIMWSERNAGGVAQIRARSLDMNQPFGSSWTQEDGDGIPGRIQFNAAMDATNPMMVQFANSKVYACWQERTSTGSNPTQVRVGLYVGGDPSVLQRWRFVERTVATANGLNRDPTQSAAAPHLAIHNNQLYAAWHESITSTTPTQIRVAMFNGQDTAPVWTFVDGNSALRGINYAPARSAQYVRIISCRSTLFATWEELNSAGVAQIRVSALGGTVQTPRWINVDGNSASVGLNVDSTMHARVPSIACIADSTLLVAWHEVVSTGSGLTRIRAKQASIPTSGIALAWKTADGNRGLNFDISQIAVNVRLRNHPMNPSTVYAAWEEVDLTSTKSQARVAIFTGGDAGPWLFADGGAKLSNVNDAQTQDAKAPVLVGSTSSVVTWYAIWQEVHATTLTSHVRASMYRTENGATGGWQSLHDRCVLRKSTTPTTSSNLILPELNTFGSLEYGRQVRIDTARPFVQNITFSSSSNVVGITNAIQTVDIFNTGSLTQGQYKLAYDGEQTVCIDWNATVAAVKTALEGIATMQISVSVTADTAAFQDATRYVIAFSFSTTGLKPLTRVTTPSCATWVCGASSPRLACNMMTLVQLNTNRNVAMHGGVVDISVQFSSPVLVTSGVPTLTLETGAVDSSAAYTSRGIARYFDVGTEGPSRMLAGGFRLAYGDMAAPSAMEMTECIDASFASDADAEQDVRSKLLRIKALRTVGIQSVSRRTWRNGFRYTILFSSSSSGDLLDLVPAEGSACNAFAGRIQTIDVQADATILQGGFTVSMEDGTSPCIPITLDTSGPSNSLEDSLSRIIPNRVIPVQVVKDTSILGAFGLRFYVSFLSLTDAAVSVRVSASNCAAFVCDDGNGGSIACTGLKVVANAGYKASQAVTNSVAFQYSVQAPDSTLALAVRDSSALAGAIFRDSLNPNLAAMLTIPSRLLNPSEIRVLSSNEIPRVTNVYSSTANDIYSAGDVIVIYVLFSLRVDVVGRPILELNSGGIAKYLSGGGTSTLEFRYKILPGEGTTDLNYASPLSLRTLGLFDSICAAGAAGQQIDADLTLPALSATSSLASQSAIIVQTSTPRILSVSSTRPDTPIGGTGYGVGDIIDLRVVFSGEIAVYGEPQIPLNSGGIATFTYGGYRQLLDVGVHAMYPVTSGQFAISYGGVVSGCVDYTDANSNSPMSLKSRLMAFADLASIGIVSVTSTAKKNGRRFEIVFDSTRVLEVPTSVVPVVSDVCAPLLPSSSDSPPAVLLERSTDTVVIFHYHVQENDASSDLDYTSTSIDLSASGSAILSRSRTPVITADPTLPATGNPNRLGKLKAIEVDGSPVVIVDIVADSNAGTYGVAYPPLASPPTVYPGEIFFRVIFSRPVKVTGSPVMELATGSSQANGIVIPNRLARFMGQPLANEAAFLYHILDGDASPNLAFANLDVLAGAEVFCVSTSSLTLARTTLPRLVVSATKVIKIDATSVPTTVKLSSPEGDEMYGAGEAIEIDVTFSKQVTLQTGLNRNHDSYARYPVAIEFGGNLFVFWTEWSSYIYKSTITTSFLNLRVFTQDTLTPVALTAPVAAAMNRFQGSFIEKTSVVVWQRELYAAWDEDGQIYCARFNGLTVTTEPWTVIPSMGANKNLQMRGSDAQLIVHNLELVMLWREEAVVSATGAIAGQIRVAQRNDDFDAPLWIFHDGNKMNSGLNKNPQNDAILPHAAVYRGSMYVSWSEYDDVLDAYQVILARRYVQSRDLSVWQYVRYTGTASDFYISSYRPRLNVRKKGYEDEALVISWYHDTQNPGISEVAYGEVFDSSWNESSTSISQQVNLTTHLLPSARILDTLACGNMMFASWVEEASVSNTLSSRVQTLRVASLKPDASIASAWSAMFGGQVVNHNPSMDVTDFALVCSGSSLSPGLLWTEFDGIATKLRFRHAVIAQQLQAESNISWGETAIGAPFLQMDTASNPSGFAFAMDRSGLQSNVLRFLYVVQPGHSAIDLDVFNQQALVLNDAQIRDTNGHLPDFTLFPRAQDPRALSFNNDISIDTTPPVVIEVTSTTPTGEYGVGEVMMVQVIFSMPVDVAGGPAMLYLRSDELHFVDYNANPATYISGSGTSTLTFRFVATERDYCDSLEYFRADSLVLPEGSSIRRASTYPITDAVLALPPPRTAHSLSGNRQISIKPTPPTVTDITSTVPDGTYFPGDTIPIAVKFTLPVVVYGRPALLLDTTQQSLAFYSDGNGTRVLTFLYVISEGDASSDLDVVDDRGALVVDYVQSLVLYGYSSIKRQSTTPTTNADVTLPPPGWPGSLSRNKNIVIDTVRPRIVNVRSLTPDGTYDVGDLIVILVEFSKRVIVRGTPYLMLNIVPLDQGELPRTAVYLDGSGSNVLRFQYVVATYDNTGTTALDTFNERAFLLRPIQLGGSMTQTAAEVLCMATVPELPANLTMPRPGPILRVDAVRSLAGNNHKIFLRTDGFRVIDMAADVTSGQTYAPGQRILISVVFADAVVVQGTPRLKLNANALLPTYAPYVGGSGTSRLRFKYDVAMGDSVQVLEAASRMSLELPAGSIITDTSGIYVPLRLGPPLLPGSLSFNYKICITSSPPAIKRVYVVNAASSNSGAFGVGDDILIGVVFDLRVGMPVGSAPPSLRLQLGNGLRVATYVSGDQTAQWLFSIRVLAGDATSSLEYADVNAFVMPTGPGILFAVATTLMLAANTVLPALGSQFSLSASNIQVVSIPPRVIYVGAIDRRGVYGLGDRLRIQVRFSYPVTVLIPESCTLELFLGGTRTAVANFVGGSSTSILVFEYRIVAGDRSGRLDYRGATSLSCNVLQMSANPSSAADTTLPGPGSEGSLAATSRIQVDSTSPRVLSVSSGLDNGVFGVGQDIDIRMTFSEAVEILDAARCNPKLRLAIANANAGALPPVALYESGSGSATLVFRYTTIQGDSALPVAYDGFDALYFDGVECGFVSLTQDRRPAVLRLPTPGGTGSLSNNRDIQVEGQVPPRVLTVTSNIADGIYTAGDSVTLTVVFTAPVLVAGQPFILLDVGKSRPGSAIYQGGSGSTRIDFSYTIQNGDHSDRLEYVRCPNEARQKPKKREYDKLVICLADSNALQLGGGTIKRVASHPSVDAVLDLPEVNLWPKLRVGTSRNDFVYVDQLEETTDLSEIDRAELTEAEHAENLVNEFSISQHKQSVYIYSNGIPSHPTGLARVEQQYFIELVRFPIVQPNPLMLQGFDGFTGIILNGIPFKTALPSTVTDSCGGALDDQQRYYYADTPTCFIDGLVELAPNPFIKIGYAFDGVPLYYYFDESGQIPQHLDECNGIVGVDGMYRYHLVPTVKSPYMPCLKAINDPPTTPKVDSAQLIRVFRFPVDIRQVDGLTLPSLSRFDGLVIDENPSTQTGVATWLNPLGISVVYSSTAITVRSNGIPSGQYGPFPNAYNPFSVREQDYVFQLPRQPVVAAQVTSLPLDTPVGVMINGVPFFSSQSVVYGGNIMDPQSKVYWMLDKCHGLVDAGGNYRYYGTPDCLLSELGGQLTPGKPSPLLGYALDGFPLYGPFGENGAAPTDLDACNGRIGDDGAYRYHVTPGSKPYLIGCFRGTPLIGASDQVERSLSYGKAIRIDTQVPRIMQIFTNKYPGVYSVGETLDLVVVWTVGVVVDTTNGVPSIVVPGSMQQAIYNPSKSTLTQSVFVYTISAVEDLILEYIYDFRSSIQLNGATIKRYAAVPTIDADLQLIHAEQNSRFASKHHLIKDLRIMLRGLYHPHASDLAVRLFHGAQSAVVFDSCCGNMAFGLPDKKLRINEKQIHIYPSNPTSGVGWDYGFQDFRWSKNLASDGGATALQSSTSGLCVASNAIDGRVHGTISEQNVARAASSATTVAWWEVRLIKPVEIGTIRVWLPQRPERRPATVQILRVDSSDGITQVFGSFMLSFTAWDGQVTVTTPISWNAVAMVRDENTRVTTPGIGSGESVEAKILAAIPSTVTSSQHLFVSRSPASAGLSPNGAFTWSITFLTDTYLFGDDTVPLAVDTNDICNGMGVVEFSKPFPGDDYDEWSYVSRDDDQRAHNLRKGHTSMFPFWILLFEDTALMNFESFSEAVNASTWSYRVDESYNQTQLVSANPPVGLKATQFVRIVAETPFAYLTLAEVEVFMERNHILSQYPSGSPVSTEFYPGAETWSPEDSFQERFGQMSSEGRWTLSIRDKTLTQQSPPEQSPTHGAGAISDWVLYVTNFADRTQTYYVDIRAKIKSLPRYGKLFVPIAETDTEHLDHDRNGVLDFVEAERYLSTYYLSFDVLPWATRQRVLWNFLGEYTLHGGIEVLADPSERQKIYPSPGCDRQCLIDLGMDPYFWPDTTGDRALKPMEIDRDRFVRFVPNEDFAGLDTFTFSITIGSQESPVLGYVELHVRECQDKDCAMDSELLHREKINP